MSLYDDDIIEMKDRYYRIFLYLLQVSLQELVYT